MGTMAESEILKFICANQGAFDTEDLLCNLGDPATVSEIIKNEDKFACCCPFGQPKVVARTTLRLCRAKECQGGCMGLHLCKNFLYSGSCKFNYTRRGCSFSHDLSSDHNVRMLTEHGLESLSRTELCTLLLQSDDRLLPSICYDYNNGAGEFGRCTDGYACKRLHICEKFLNRNCVCNRCHDFSALQPLQALGGVPEEVFCSLKSIYANKQALRYYDSKVNHPTRGGHQGNRGARGFRGRRGNPKLRGQTGSTSDILAALHLDSDDDPEVRGEQLYAAAYDSDASSEGSQSRKQARNPYRGARRGRGGHRGNRGKHQRMQQTHSDGVPAGISVLELMDFDGPIMDCSETRLPKPSSSDVSAAGAAGAAGVKWPKQQEKEIPAPDKTEICMYFVKGKCYRGEQCSKAHDKMPYRWEMKHGDQWTAMTDNEAIERDYCDPQNTHSSSSPPVFFDTMTCGFNQVRRLSTINSLLQPDFILTTQWLWYWEDEFGIWNLYGPTPRSSQDSKHSSDSFDSPPVLNIHTNQDTCLYDLTASVVARRSESPASFRKPEMTKKKVSPKFYPRNKRIKSTVSVHFGSGRNKQAATSDDLYPICKECHRKVDGKVSDAATISQHLQEGQPSLSVQVKDGGNKVADIDSSELEQKFLDNAQDVVDFKAGSQTYSLNFEYMQQTNKQYSTKKNVKRRPRFVSAVDVKATTATTARKNLFQANFGDIPEHWDKTQVPETGYKRVALLRSSKEFKETEALFYETMKGCEIVKIERIQNKQLWDAFQLQKTHMKNNNGRREVAEKMLFHGTDSKHVDVICHSNFDWRLCGVHGTSFGKGTYFARDAKYSNDFTSASGVKSMFIARLLVGEYTQGFPDYRRPPFKDKECINLFDSCVNNVAKPSIYVIFEKQQIYPEYLLQYKVPNGFGASTKPKAVVQQAPPPVKPAPQTTPQVSATAQKTTTPHQPAMPPSKNPDTSCLIA